jgi:hypothetical protein
LQQPGYNADLVLAADEACERDWQVSACAADPQPTPQRRCGNVVDR